MAHILTGVPRIMAEALPQFLFHGTNEGGAIRANGMRASKANAAGRGVYGFAWFFATEEAALGYCMVPTEDAADGCGLPEVLVYRYVGTMPLLDLRGLEKDDIDGLGGALHNEAVEQARAAGVVIHSTTPRPDDEWGFIVSENLQYLESRHPTEAWYAQKEQEQIDHEAYLDAQEERRAKERALEERLQQARQRYVQSQKPG
jgi:hypothetical protein